jgi:hypothetical protein
VTGGRRIVEGVVADPAVVGGADGGHRAVLRDRAVTPADHDLIALGAAVGVLDVDEDHFQVLAESGGGRLFDRGENPAAPGVPALFR